MTKRGCTEGTLELSPKLLTLPWDEWKKLDLSKLDPECKKWLHAWDLCDLALSPMDDNERRFMRCGHYLGWIDAKDKLEERKEWVEEVACKLQQALAALEEEMPCEV